MKRKLDAEIANMKVEKRLKVSMDKVEEKTDEISELKRMLVQAKIEIASLKSQLENSPSGEKNLNVIYTRSPIILSNLVSCHLMQ